MVMKCQRARETSFVSFVIDQHVSPASTNVLTAELGLRLPACIQGASILLRLCLEAKDIMLCKRAVFTLAALRLYNIHVFKYKQSLHVGVMLRIL